MQQIPNKIFFNDIAEQISNGKQVRIRAKGNSMLPFIRDGKDEIVLEKLTVPVQAGMLLLVKLDNGNYVLHRVAKTNADKIVLRGDGNLTAREVCETTRVVAKASAVIRGGKTITEGSCRWSIYRRAWPAHFFLRRVLLAVYRRWERW